MSGYCLDCGNDLCICDELGLENKYNSGQVGMDYRNILDKEEIKKLQEQNKIMREALESIAFYDEPLANTYDYWSKIADKSKFPLTLASDTDIAREALAEVGE